MVYVLKLTHYIDTVYFILLIILIDDKQFPCKYKMTCGLFTYINMLLNHFGLPSSANSKSPYTCITLIICCSVKRKLVVKISVMSLCQLYELV